MFSKTDSVIFDLDGTLWDSTATVARAWQAAIEQVDFVEETITQAKVQAITGMAYDAIYRKLYPQLSEEQRSTLKQVCGVQELKQIQEEGGRLYDGLEDTLQYLQSKYPLFIVSNCQSGYIEAFLNHYGFHAYFKDHDCYGNAERSKAANIADVIRRNDLKNPVYVGDTQGDYEASRENNIPFIYASYGFGQPEYYHARIDSVRDLQKVL